MGIEPNPPPGYRLLLEEEIILPGDLFSASWVKGWIPVRSTIGKTPSGAGFSKCEAIWCRKEEPEKEWLNGWD